MATTNEQTVLNLRGMTITIASDESIYVRKGEMTVHIDFTEGEPLMEWWSTCMECERSSPEATRCPHCDPVDVE
jgi:uncharacterized protein with PIN domain